MKSLLTFITVAASYKYSSYWCPDLPWYGFIILGFITGVLIGMDQKDEEKNAPKLQFHITREKEEVK